MDRITRFSLKNVTVIVLASLLVTMGGIYTSGTLQKETMPDVSIPIVAIVTPYPGASPSDVYEDVSEPLEQVLAGTQGLAGLSGYSNDSVSVIVGDFEYSADLDAAEDEMIKAMSTVELPENAFEPEIIRISFGSAPILKVAVTGGESTEWLRDYARDEIVPVLESLDGAGDVSMNNDEPGEVGIVFDPEALEEHGLSASDVIQQLQASNLSFPVGSVVVSSTEEPIRVSGTLDSVEDIENLKIAIYPNMNLIYGEALASMGEGMGALGEAVGQMGVGMGQLGSAVGQLGEGMGELGIAVGELGTGMGEMGEGLGMQIGLVSALQATQADLLDAKIALAEANMVMLDPMASPAEIAAAQATIAQMSAMIPALEGAVAAIEAELAAAQAAAAAAAPSGSAASPSLPAAPGGVSTPSAPSSSDFDADAEIEEPTIELIELGELAEITYDSGADGIFSRMDGDDAVLIDVIKTQDGNTVAISEEAIAELETLRESAPDDVDIELTFDASVEINKSIWDMIREGLVGGFFAVIVMLVFLRNFRSTLIAAISIPMSIVAALLVIGQFDVTLNTMTLGGITVAIGRIVDDSIVVIENIYRHMQIGEERNSELLRVATKEVSSAITSSTLTTVAVFAPMALVSGIVGKIFTPFALTVAVALLASLLVAVAVVPVVAKWTMLRAKVPPRNEEHEASNSYYARLLKWALGHKKTVMGTAFAIFLGSLALLPIVGMGFIPPATANYASIDVAYPTGTTAETVDAALAEVEEAMAARDDVIYTQASVGKASGFDIAAGSNQGSVFVKFSDESEIEEVVTDVRDDVAFLQSDEVAVAVSAADVSGAGANSIDLVITGSNFNDIAATAAMIEEAIASVDGLENIKSNVSEERPQIAVDVDQVKAAEYGLNTAMVAGTLRGYVADESAGSVQFDGTPVDLVYSVGQEKITSAEDVAAIEMQTPLGDTIVISDIARVEETGTPVSILTLDERRYAAVSASVADRDSNSVIMEVQDVLDELPIPASVDVKVSGMAEMMAEAFEQLGIAMIVAIFAVYLVMVIAFGEAVAPLAIMVSLPLAIIGGLIGLLVAGIPLDMPAMIGALMLIGIVTTNAIVLIDRVHQKLDEGRPRRDALLEAGAERIRPILMTALTTIGALLPMAVGMAEGALMSQSLAITVVGGLTTSTALTLVVVPVVYDWMEGIKDRFLARLAMKPIKS